MNHTVTLNPSAACPTILRRAGAVPLTGIEPAPPGYQPGARPSSYGGKQRSSREPLAAFRAFLRLCCSPCKCSPRAIGFRHLLRRSHCGSGEIRTRNRLRAKQPLSRWSYRPETTPAYCGGSRLQWIRPELNRQPLVNRVLFRMSYGPKATTFERRRPFSNGQAVLSPLRKNPPRSRTLLREVVRATSPACAPERNRTFHLPHVKRALYL